MNNSVGKDRRSSPLGLQMSTPFRIIEMSPYLNENYIGLDDFYEAFDALVAKKYIRLRKNTAGTISLNLEEVQ